MLQTSTTAAASGDNVVQFPEDIIPLISGITLADAHAEIIARRLRADSWADRTLFFNNIIVHSIENTLDMLKYAKSRDDGGRFLDWGLCEIMRRIGEVIDLLGEAKPADNDAAVLFLLSLNPAHRRAAHKFIVAGKRVADRTVHDDWRFVDGYMQDTWPTLSVFFRMVAVSNPEADAAWQAGARECPQDWHNLPDDPAPTVGAA